MKYLLLLITVIYIFTFSLYAQDKIIFDTALFWSKTPLKGSDFTIVSDGGLDSPYLANILPLLNAKCRFKKIGRKNFIQIKSLSYLQKNKSWIKKSFIHDTVLLKHEQGHFDIAEIYARKLIKCFDTAYFSSNYLKEVDEIFKKITTEVDLEQSKYDTETKHASNRIWQELWNRKIQFELNMSDRYFNAIGTYRIHY